MINFFEQDSISRVSPKKVDVILVKKQPVAKRFMLLTIGGAFAKFKSDFSQYDIDKSQFYALRPRHVKPMSIHDTRCCLYHENFDLVLKVSRQLSLDSLLIMLFLLQAWNHLYSTVFCARQLLMHVITENVAPADINTHPTTCCSISLAIRMKTYNGLFGSVQIIVWHCNRSSEVSAYFSMRSTTNGTAMSLIITV